jgi:L-ascorbate metabolism protein UlaG (beta-lactamase superfamily)
MFYNNETKMKAMKLKAALVFSFALVMLAAEAQLPAPDRVPVSGGDLTIQPVNHATLVLSYQNKNIYVDPSGDAAAFKGIGAPDIILITDIHGDHFDPKSLAAIQSQKVVIMAPQAVADKMPPDLQRKQLIVINNGEKTMQEGIAIAAIPMYNLPEAADAFHTKGRGNGYVLTIGGKNIYISGDTEDIPEMRTLKDIDIAFICMNLPYTMDVTQAAQAVLAFKPKIVYPYHYRGQDVNTFKKLVNDGDKNIEVRLRDWYAGGK